MIKAEIHSDDRVFECEFDATLWFEQAGDDEIIKLCEICWHLGTQSDEVGLFFEDSNPDIAALLNYCRRVDGLGFEVSVDGEDALVWLDEHRSHIAGQCRDM